MADTNLFDDIQEAIDGMQHVLQQCVGEECSVGDMWAEIDAHCQRLAQLSAGNIPDDEDDEDENAADELNFDELERDGEDDEDDEDDGAMH